MTGEPTHDQITGDENEPATKGYVKTELQAAEQRLRDFIVDQAEETRRHFDVVAENIHRDVAGANQDQVSLLKDQKIPDLEKRVDKLEQVTGLPA